MLEKFSSFKMASFAVLTAIRVPTSASCPFRRALGRDAGLLGNLDPGAGAFAEPAIDPHLILVAE